MGIKLTKQAIKHDKKCQNNMMNCDDGGGAQLNYLIFVFGWGGGRKGAIQNPNIYYNFFL